MEPIKINQSNQTPNHWEFIVIIGDSKSSGSVKTVTIKKDYWQQLTDGQEKPAELLRRSIEFLLEREPKESILAEFDLKVISQYFPDYEKTIRTK